MAAITITDLNNAKLDVDHIAAVATSTDPTAVNRIGGVVPTINAVSVAIAAKVAAVEAEKNTAIAISIPAAVALVDAAVAATAVGEAIAAKVDAENARDAAIIGAELYLDYATGLADVADGAVFRVQGSGDVAAYVYRRINAGASTALPSIPSSAALDFFSLKDMNSRFAVGDLDGNLAFRVDLEGRVVTDFSLIPNIDLYETGGTYDYEVNHYFGYGQSLSVGAGGAVPALSLTQNYDNLMFTKGFRPHIDDAGEAPAQWYAGLVPAVEATYLTYGESPSMGAGDMIKARILAEAGLAHTDMTYQILLSNPGISGQSIAQLSKGTANYNRLIEQATYGLALAAAAGKTYAVQAVSWMQGEQNIGNPQAGHVTALNTLVADLNTDIKAVTGQTKGIPLISYQLASHKVGGAAVPAIALALLECEGSNALVYLALPMYQFQYYDNNNFHLTNASSRWVGAYLGLAYKRIVIDGVDWKPLKPISSMKQGSIAVVKFHVPYGRLALDTTLVAENTNYGFELVDSADAPLTISSVAIMGPDTVKIIAAATIPAGAKLRYAWSGSGNVGNTVGPRGNLRDTQGDKIICDPDGINKRMDNWCVIFEWGL